MSRSGRRLGLRSRGATALVLVGALLQGCASYPSGVATRGQDEPTVRREHEACREEAREEVESPLLAGLGKKAVMALGGAPIGAGIGFVVGSVAGTFVGADETLRAVRAREYVFTRCMTQRGYQLPDTPRR